MRVQQTLANAVSCAGVGSIRTARYHHAQACATKYRGGLRKPKRQKRSLPRGLRRAFGADGTLHRNQRNGFQVKTIEHILAALAGLDVDNVYVEVDAAEAPVMDGSAAHFVRLIRSAGIVPQSRRQPYLKITRPLELVDGARRVRIEPSSTTNITHSIHYNHPLIQTQTFLDEH